MLRLQPMNLLRGILNRMCATGLVLGTLFFAFSLTPSLVPRPFAVQGIVSGLSLTAGYALGFAAAWLWRFLEMPMPGPRVSRAIKLCATALCTLTAVLFLWRATGWQNALREMMGMAPAGGGRFVSMAAIALVVFGVMLAIGWAFRRTFHLLSSKVGRFVPHRVSLVIGLVAAFALFWLVIQGVAFSWLLRIADRSYQQLDAMIEGDLEPPADAWKTGSTASLLQWADLGRRGREFVALGPTAEQIEALTNAPALEPIRVYVGLNAADTPHERARLAIEELKRVGAFERSVLLLVTPTGTGWIDPASQSPVEYLHHGDIATVAAQYSYLPSHLALTTEGQYGAEMARALFVEVYSHWTSLPRDERPRLYLHGLSLGALNSDLSFDAYDILADPFDGVLWAGPPFRSETWNHVTANRAEGSPAWLPRFRDGAVVRFMNQDGGLEVGEAPWGPHRIAYLQYASDPITFFSVESLYREPAWLRQPRGPDVHAALRWYPVVTFLQLAADMAVGGAPPGYGHSYAARHYIDAWVALTEPAGWSAEDLQRLRALFDAGRE